MLRVYLFVAIQLFCLPGMALAQNQSLKEILDQNVANEVTEQVLEKKWSIGDQDCGLSGGTYTVFSRKNGYYSVVRGDRDKYPRKFRYQAYTSGPNKDAFMYTSTLLAGDSREFKALPPEIPIAHTQIFVRMLPDGRIEKLSIMKLIDMASLTQESISHRRINYETKSTTTYGSLCN